MSHVARLGIKVCRNIKCMKRESQECAEHEDLSVSLSLFLFTSVHEHVYVQKRLPLTHLKVDGIRSCVRDARARASCAHTLQYRNNKIVKDDLKMKNIP